PSHGRAKASRSPRRLTLFRRNTSGKISGRERTTARDSWRRAPDRRREAPQRSPRPTPIARSGQEGPPDRDRSPSTRLSQVVFGPSPAQKANTAQAGLRGRL